MLKRMAAVVSVVLLLLPAAALGEPYSSDDLGFTADFPVAPTVGDPTGSEKDKDGNFISTSVTFLAREQGVYMAGVTVDSYVVPTNLDVAQSLINERDSFLKPLNASYTSSNSGTQDGNPALLFSYDTPDHSTAGSAIVAIVTAEKPRIYLAITMHTPNASAAQIADLDKFLKSFQIK